MTYGECYLRSSALGWSLMSRLVLWSTVGCMIRISRFSKINVANVFEYLLQGGTGSSFFSLLLSKPSFSTSSYFIALAWILRSLRHWQVQNQLQLLFYLLCCYSSQLAIPAFDHFFFWNQFEKPSSLELLLSQVLGRTLLSTLQEWHFLRTTATVTSTWYATCFKFIVDLN